MIILLGGGVRVEEEYLKRGVIYWAVFFADREAQRHYEKGGDYVSEWISACDLIIKLTRR